MNMQESGRANRLRSSSTNPLPTDLSSSNSAINNSTSSHHAVVLGGSIAGLMAARVLADHFDKVTLIERDVFPNTTETRRGIPQANHVHGLLLRGRQILEQLFPGLQDEMMAAGAPLVDMANDIAWFTPAGWGVRFPSELKVLTFTRPMLDLYVRRRLEKHPKVRILDNKKVVALARSTTKSRIGGVLLANDLTDSDRTVAKTLRADLVVDATGRSSPAPRWLAELGYQKPEETIIDAQLGYASRLYEIPSDFKADWSCTFVQAAPPDQKRGAILFRVEGDRWLVTLVGGGRDYPPGDEAEFLEFTRTLSVSTIYDAIKNAKPISPIKTHKATQNRLRHFDRLKSLPENFLLLGDAVCAFNPVYGQGMTMAAMGVVTLDTTLHEFRRKGFKNLSYVFQKRLANQNKAAWTMATAQDLRYRETVGGRPGLKTRFMHRYIDHVIELATRSEAVRQTLLQSFSMLVPPTALFRPAILFRVLRQVFIKRETGRKPKRQPRRALSQAHVRK